MLGIGLGGFMDGFTKGYGLREDMKDRQFNREQAKIEAEDRARLRTWEKEDRDFERSERDRLLKRRNAVDDIAADAREEFAEGVESGQYDPKEFDKFWRDYALPKMRNELLLQGDTKGATELMKWGESEAARQGGRLFSSALLKAQTGDPSGALDDIIKAGKINGYIDHDFDIGDKEDIRDPDGELLGFRLTFTDGDGNVLKQDIALDDVPTVVATFGNPQAAWESQQTRRAEKQERADELEDFETKENIKANAGTKSRSKAIETLRERMATDELSDPDAKSFDDLSRDEQERLIEEELALQGGERRPEAEPAKVIVDEDSGQVVQPMPKGEPAEAPGMKSGDAAPATTRAVGLAPAGPRPGDAKAAAVKDARDMLSQGTDPQIIAKRLQGAGVPPSELPRDMVDQMRGASW